MFEDKPAPNSPQPPDPATEFQQALATMGPPVARYLLAVHAPAMPTWFRASGEPAPPMLPEQTLLTPTAQAMYQFASKNDCDFPHVGVPFALYEGGDQLTPTLQDLQAVERFASAFSDFEEAVGLRKIEIERLRMAQWPWVYADSVLSARATGTEVARG